MNRFDRRNPPSANTIRCSVISATVPLFALPFLAGLPALAETTDLTIRHAPYVVSTVSSKSEKAWSKCRYCGTKISYERKYKWDVYNKEWVETTKNVPDVCRSCKPKDKAQEKLDREEAKLDREIEYLETKQRIDAKERKLRQLRKQTR